MAKQHKHAHIQAILDQIKATQDHVTNLGNLIANLPFNDLHYVNSAYAYTGMRRATYWLHQATLWLKDRPVSSKGIKGINGKQFNSGGYAYWRMHSTTTQKYPEGVWLGNIDQVLTDLVDQGKSQSFLIGFAFNCANDLCSDPAPNYITWVHHMHAYACDLCKLGKCYACKDLNCLCQQNL